MRLSNVTVEDGVLNFQKPWEHPNVELCKVYDALTGFTPSKVYLLPDQGVIFTYVLGYDYSIEKEVEFVVKVEDFDEKPVKLTLEETPAAILERIEKRKAAPSQMPSYGEIVEDALRKAREIQAAEKAQKEDEAAP